MVAILQLCRGRCFSFFNYDVLTPYCVPTVKSRLRDDGLNLNPSIFQPLPMQWGWFHIKACLRFFFHTGDIIN